MCGLGKHEKHMTEMHTFEYTEAHVYILCHKHNFQPYSKAMLSHLQSAQPDHRLGSTCLSSWVSFLRHNTSSGGFFPRSGLVGLSDWAERSVTHADNRNIRMSFCSIIGASLIDMILLSYTVGIDEHLNVS